ncbi:hypothetical protein EDI_317220 [Entamoeba dispar SAW760]|uniref:Uncharacterized protein n=1 Tax=Entamoeba dispar (strain ATCC PRA-260 / SAW760) TaxID=370354 RepID=B0EB48_ENTDS|nr:uncharacterized protein EDI_317220 [Entamoeba dispar SAW760]EDR28265.1 hypothetical protein EDI_317220 [Entamoeba dispar SAW760]|eukprot:EDR28265.1 hypothetical protein EDI_317220 [Entamoeba dispar SAW760]
MQTDDILQMVMRKLLELTLKVKSLSETVVVLEKTVLEMKKTQITTELENRAQRLLSASAEQCKKLEHVLSQAQNDVTNSIEETAQLCNDKLIEGIEATSTRLTYTKRDMVTTRLKIEELEKASFKINRLLRMNDLAQISTKGSIPKRVNVTTAIYEDKIYKLSPVWLATISSNSITGRKCVSLYTEDKKQAVHIYYSDEKYFYFFNENEFKYDLKEDSITQLKVELHLEWKRLACEVVNIPTGSFFSKSRNGKSAVFYVRESMICVRLDSGDIIVLDANSNSIYVNTRKLIL